MKKVLCIFLSAIILFLTSCNVAEPIDIPDEIESHSESSPESASTPIEEPIPSPEVSERDTTDPKSPPPDPEEDIEITFAPDDVKIVNFNIIRGNSSLEKYHNSAASNSVIFNNKTFYYKYSREYRSYNIDFYQTNDELMELNYYSGTSKISSFSDYTFNTDNVPKTEEECKKLAESLILTYSNVSLSEYTYSCLTHYTQHYDNGAGNQNVSYFYIPDDPSQELTNHTFIYTRYVGEHKTSDQISIKFNYYGSFEGFSINWGYDDFKDVTEVDINYTDARKAIDAYYMDVGFKYDRLFSYADADAEDFYLSFYNGKIYLVCPSAMKYYDIKWSDVKNDPHPVSAWLEDLLVDLEPIFDNGETSKDLSLMLDPLMTMTAASYTLKTSFANENGASPNEYAFDLGDDGQLICIFAKASDLIDDMQNAKHTDILVSARIIHPNSEEELLFDVSETEGFTAEDIVYYPLLRIEYLKKLKANMSKKEVIDLIGKFHVSDNDFNGYYYLESEQLLYLEYDGDILVDARVINATGGYDNIIVEVLFDTTSQDQTN